MKRRKVKMCVNVYKDEAFATFLAIKNGRDIYRPNQVYLSTNKKFPKPVYYYINTREYMHVLLPEALKMNGKILHYTIRDYMLTLDNMLRDKGFSGTYNTMEEALAYLDQLSDFSDYD